MGYTVYDTSYVNLNKFGIGDLYFHANVVLTIADAWYTVGYIPEAVKPGDLRYVYCFVIGDDEKYYNLRAVIDSDCNIKVYVIQHAGYAVSLNKARDILIFGTYCI